MKVKHLFIITGLVVSILFGVQAMAADNIKVGAPDPLTGYYASDGNVMLNATEMALADINAQGGLLGRKLKVVSFDVEDMLPEKLISAGSY